MSEIDLEKVLDEISEVLAKNGIESDTYAINVHLSETDFDHVMESSIHEVQATNHLFGEHM